MSIENTLADRGGTHGDWTEMTDMAQSMKMLVRAGASWESMSAGQREAVELICLKVARICTGNPSHPDHWHDIEGYAKLGGQK